MRQLTEQEIKKAMLLRAARSAINLKHALQAYEEVQLKLPALEKKIDAALSSGKTFELDTDSLLKESDEA